MGNSTLYTFETSSYFPPTAGAFESAVTSPLSLSIHHKPVEILIAHMAHIPQSNGAERAATDTQVHSFTLYTSQLQREYIHTVTKLQYHSS